VKQVRSNEKGEAKINSLFAGSYSVVANAPAGGAGSVVVSTRNQRDVPEKVVQGGGGVK
jgi:hypothetical protein